MTTQRSALNRPTVAGIETSFDLPISQNSFLWPPALHARSRKTEFTVCQPRIAIAPHKCNSFKLFRESSEWVQTPFYLYFTNSLELGAQPFACVARRIQHTGYYRFVGFATRFYHSLGDQPERNAKLIEFAVHATPYSIFNVCRLASRRTSLRPIHTSRIFTVGPSN